MIKVESIYPITTITYPNGGELIRLILDTHLEQYTSPIKMPSLQHELRGQTRSMEGVYAGDVERWLNKLPNND